MTTLAEHLLLIVSDVMEPNIITIAIILLAELDKQVDSLGAMECSMFSAQSDL